jgi:mycofactocin precursor
MYGHSSLGAEIHRNSPSDDEEQALSKQTAIAESEQAAEPAAPDAEPVVDDLLVEEISIDGMCGVY